MQFSHRTFQQQLRQQDSPRPFDAKDIWLACAVPDPILVVAEAQSVGGISRKRIQQAV